MSEVEDWIELSQEGSVDVYCKPSNEPPCCIRSGHFFH
jgi:hypothetical protein